MDLSESGARRAAVMIRRARVPLRVAIGVVGGLAVGIPLWLGLPSLAVLGLAVVVALAVTLAAVSHPGAFRWAAHSVYGLSLVAAGYAVFGLGLAPVITVYVGSFVLLASAQILGARAALFWSFPALGLVAASAFDPPAITREVSVGLTFAVRAVTLVTILGFAVSFRRAQDRQAAELERRATTDSLTGLANRSALIRALGDALERARRYERTGAVLYLDLDGLKPVNDRLGHAAGDELIRVTAERIASVTRSVDTAARIGGDEFVLLLAELGDPKGSEVVARKLQKVLRRPFTAAGQTIATTGSIGVTRFGGPAAAASGDDLLREADAAMYAAKRAGGDRIYLHAEGGPRELR